MRIRKRPLELEARPYDGSNKAARELCEWVNDNDGCAWPLLSGRFILIRLRTDHGDRLVYEGDYVIKGPHGDFYTCPPQKFKDRYEVIDEHSRNQNGKIHSQNGQAHSA